MRIIATAGHVDHGKSSLVQALTGTNPDRWEEEQRRGLTIDLGFAHTTLPADGESSAADISFIDVPGHVRFLRNMLAGVGGVDACLFVVAATEGWKPQSEEHLRILELLGIRHGVVALTIADLVDDDWLELQRIDVRERLDGSFLHNASLTPVSATTGLGLDELRAELRSLHATTPATPDRDRPRLWVDRVFSVKGSGTVVTGTLTGGPVRVDDQLHAGAHPVRVRGIQSHGEHHDAIGPGNRVALNLAGVEHTHLRRGDCVVRPAQWRPTQRFDATLTVLPSLAHVVSRRGAYFAYVGSGEFPVKVRVLGAESLRPGATGVMRIHLAEPVPLVAGDRFVLRDAGREETVGGGEVLDVAPIRPASKAAPDRDVDRLVAEHGWLRADDLEAYTGERRAPDVGAWIVAPAELAATADRVRQRVDAAGEIGLDIATLTEQERAVAASLDDISVDAGRARRSAAVDPLADHPFIAALLDGRFTPPAADGVDRQQLRELVRRGLVVQLDGLYFHPATLHAAATVAAELLDRHPTGFTLSQFREALGNTRKHAVPLASELDARGVTRRRDDLRIAGPRLPTR